MLVFDTDFDIGLISQHLKYQYTRIILLVIQKNFMKTFMVLNVQNMLDDLLFTIYMCLTLCLLYNIKYTVFILVFLVCVMVYSSNRMNVYHFRAF